MTALPLSILAASVRDSSPLMEYLNSIEHALDINVKILFYLKEIHQTMNIWCAL